VRVGKRCGVGWQGSWCSFYRHRGVGRWLVGGGECSLKTSIDSISYKEEEGGVAPITGGEKEETSCSVVSPA
jgi:hypothetical protein